MRNSDPSGDSDSEPGARSAEKVRGGVQSLGRAFGLLSAIADSQDGIGLTPLSRKVGLNSSTVFHLLKTMTAYGFVRQAEEGKRYFIGSGLFCLAASARSEVQLVGVADPFLHELAERTGDTSVFGMHSGNEMIVVAKSEGNGAFQISDRVGGARPSHCTAMGKVLLAAMRTASLQQYLRDYEPKAYTPNTITDRARLLAELDDVRRSGLAFDDAEFHPELRCVASPVRDFTGQVIGALAVSGPAWRLSLQGLQEKSLVLQEFAERLSSALGHARTDLAARTAPQSAPKNPRRNRTAHPMSDQAK